MEKIFWPITGLVIILFSLSCCMDNFSREEEGEGMVIAYCGSCHQPTYPDLLDSITWVDHVLPAMAPKLGIKVWGKNNYVIPIKEEESTTRISYGEWLKLVSFFKERAPKELKPAAPPRLLDSSQFGFKVHLPQNRNPTAIATTSLVKIDSKSGQIFTGDATSRNLVRWNQSLEPNLVGKMFSPPVDLFLGEEDTVVTNIGTLSGRNLNTASGEIRSLGSEKRSDSTRAIANKIPRPVQAVPIDFNKDGRRDWVVCAFGHDQGGLLLYEKIAGNQYKEGIISEMPGAEQAMVMDYNHDGWPDIVALFAQAREGIWVFLNDQEGGFIAKNLLEFPPVYGSTSFQLVDFNQDGLVDILYTSGDNADYSPVLKPFHGMYIFINKGKDQFEQAYFYPINGCTKAIAADFNGDGNLNIATIAFFSDFKTKPQESFIYFEQTDSLDFIPHAIPVHQYGRWISMDVGDVDGDGDLDIVLGNFSRGFKLQEGLEEDWDLHHPFILLENTNME